ncbi:outer-membrane lipoprotein carrier protein LolA [Hyphococcus flavus]|uniref:Outer-membrane lipoprotein carrier protein LolA n=1 Tax=Hyphococcus flavus TaxID=1866326 RepID=A0AAE9ZE37_9PROT|nr:outer-membrane lipoprotein carrier protein LolA [Hyphococcus flavus]WDI32896.1 outer-membrane lipoprotein carrier protein LolA [Hyphococcus flavus]
MSFALLSMISLTCADFVAPQTAAASNTIAVAMVQEETSQQQSTQPQQDAAESSQREEAAGLPLEDDLVFEEEDDDTVAENLISYIENLDTLNGDFTQIAPSGAISSGKFYLRRPGFLRFEYNPPTPLLIVANGGLVYVRDQDLETTDSYPVGKTPLKFLLSREIDRDDAKIVSVDRGVDNVAVTFSSTNEETEGELTLIASAPEFDLRRWIVRDAQNGITVVTLDNVKVGERLDRELFRAPDAGGRFLDR